MEFGIEWNHTTSNPITCLNRLGDATNFKVDTSTSPHASDFSKYYPWAGMERVFVNETGDVLSPVAERVFEEDAVNVLVRIPYFFIKLEFDPYSDSLGPFRYWISPYPLKGYTPHPAFMRGVTRTSTEKRLTDIYIGAYEANIDGADLVSSANKTPTTSTQRVTFRSAYKNVGLTGLNAFQAIDWKAWNALQWLYLLEYGSLDSQSPSGTKARGGLSAGITNTDLKEKTGWTSSVNVAEHSRNSRDLKNLSGQVHCNSHEGQPVYAMSYRGIENMWGNTWTMCDGVVVDPSRHLWICNNDTPTTQAAAAIGTPYRDTGTVFTAGTDWLWLKYPTKYINREGDWMFGYGPGYIATSGSGTTYMCDRFYPPTSWATYACFPSVGGSFASLTSAGVFTTSLILGYEAGCGSISGSAYGSRAMQIPLVIDFWKY